MKHFPICLTSLVLAITCAALGCNNDGGLLGKISETKPEHQELTQQAPQKIVQEVPPSKPEEKAPTPEPTKTTPTNNNVNADQKSKKLPLGIDYTDFLKPTLTNDEMKLHDALQLNLYTHVLLEITKEKGKNTKQFFVIKNCLKPCLKSPSTCYDDMADYYHESIYKLIRSTTALIFILSSLNPDTFTRGQMHLFPISLAASLYIAAGQTDGALTGQLYNLNISNDNLNDLRKQFYLSPIGSEILNSPLDDKSKQRLIGIWFLRQVHYAVESILSKQDYSKDKYNTYIKTLETLTDLDDILSIITYESMPSNIDWSKYNSSKQNTEHINLHRRSRR